MESLENLKRIAARFSIAGTAQTISKLGDGNVNDTYLVETDAHYKNKYVLQRINQEVFKNPDQIALNIIKVSEHLSQKHDQSTDQSASRWEIPALVKCTNGMLLHKESPESIWRITTYLDKSIIYQQTDSRHLAKETGRVLGRFHSLLFELDKNQLFDTLPGFHNTPLYLKQYDQTIAKGFRHTDNPDIRYCFQFVTNKRHIVAVLEETKKRGLTSTAIIHGDPKINNVLFDENTNCAFGMIDLDTVKPGLVLHDIGDCLRSSCNPAGEEAQNPDNVSFSLDFANELIGGYLESAADLISLKDKSLIYDAVRLLAFELGLRFLTDHLNGNIYFKTTYENQNLNRAVVQFKLTEDIERKKSKIKNLTK